MTSVPIRRGAPAAALETFARTERVIAFCRVLLAIGTLALVVADPTLPSYRRDLAYPILIFYVLLSGVLFSLVRGDHVRREVMAPLTTVIDVVWIAIMTLFTERVASPFFLLNVFVILSVSLRWGLRAAAPATLLLAFMYPLIIYFGRLIDPTEFPFHRAQLLRPIYLVPIGYLLGYLGEHERRSKTKLAFMLGLTLPTRSGTSPGRTMTRIMRQTLRHFGAQRGVLVLHDPDNGRFFTWEMAFDGRRSSIKLRIAERDPFPLPFLQATEGVLVNQLMREDRTALCYDISSRTIARRAITPGTRLPCDTTAVSLLMAPVVVQHLELRGRAFMVRNHGRKFTRDDLEFLLLLVGQVAGTLESRRLQAKAEEVAVLEERARIGRDLHDGFIQSLAGIDMRVEACKTWLQRDPARLPRELDHLQQAVERGYKEVRHFLDVLRATSRPAADLGAAIDRLATEFANGDALRVRVDRPSQTPSLPAETTHELAQIVREALNNAVRHGRASEVTVKLGARASHVHLAVRDNGGGFNGTAVADAEGFLGPSMQPWSIRERTTALGGILRVWSRPGEGAEISLTIPTADPRRDA